ncbi:hypothetical protein IC582_030695 [Cucumis melo]
MDLPGPIHDFLVVLLGSGLILGSMGVLLFNNSIYSAFSLGLVLVSISLFYILANAQFVAAAQLLIYVGAINVLIIFAVMFMRVQNIPKILIFGPLGMELLFWFVQVFFVSLMTTIVDTSWYGIIWTTRSNQILEQDLISNSQQIGIYLSTYFFLPFELISIILLAALIGAISVARQ